MTEFSVKINSGNDALVGDEKTFELARILTDIAGRILAGRHADAIMDINGNNVGQWWLAFDEGEDL